MRGSAIARWMGPLVAATVLGTGALAVWIVAVMWTVSVSDQLLRRNRPYDYVVITLDGELLLATNQGDGRVLYRTPAGETRVQPEDRSAQSSQLPSPEGPAMAIASWLFRVVGFYEAKEPGTYWYLVTEVAAEPSVYLVGYNVPSRRVIGYLGRGGFRTDLPPRQDRFAVAGNTAFSASFVASEKMTLGSVPYYYRQQHVDSSPILLISDGKLLSIDLERRRVTPLEMPAEAVSVKVISEPKQVEDEREVIYTPQFAVRLVDRIMILDQQQKPVRSVVLPPELRQVNLSLYSTFGPGAIVQTHRRGDQDVELYFVDDDGAIKRHERLSLNAQTAEDRRTMGWIASVALPSPAPLALFALELLPEFDSSAPDYQTALEHSREAFGSPLVALCLLSAVLAVWSFRRHRHYAPRDAAAWATFVLVAGVPGLIGYLLYRRWPHRQQCDRCGALVPRDRLACLACADEFPVPAAEAIEIFA